MAVEASSTFSSFASMVPGLVDSSADAKLAYFRAQRNARQHASSYPIYDPRHFVGPKGEILVGGLIPHVQAAAEEDGLTKLRAGMVDATLLAGRFARTAGTFAQGVGIGALVAPGLQPVLGSAVAAANGIHSLERAAQEQRDVAAGMQEGRTFATRAQVLDEAGNRSKVPLFLQMTLGQHAQGVVEKVARANAFFSETHRQAKTAERLRGEINGVGDTLSNYDGEITGKAMSNIADTNEIVGILSRYVTFDKGALVLTESGEGLIQGTEELARRDVVKARATLVDLEARLQFFERHENSADFTFSLLNIQNGQMDASLTYKFLKELRDILVPPMNTDVFNFQVEGRVIALEAAQRKTQKGMRSDRLAHALGTTAMSLVGVSAGMAAGVKLHELWAAHREEIKSVIESVAANVQNSADKIGQVTGVLAAKAKNDGASMAQSIRGLVKSHTKKISGTLTKATRHLHDASVQPAMPLRADGINNGILIGPQNIEWDQIGSTQHGLRIHNGVISFNEALLHSTDDPLLRQLTRATGRQLTNRDELIFIWQGNNFEVVPLSSANTLHLSPGTKFSLGFITGPDNRVLPWNEITTNGVPAGGHTAFLATSHMPANIGSGAPNHVLPATHIPSHDGRGAITSARQLSLKEAVGSQTSSWLENAKDTVVKSLKDLSQVWEVPVIGSLLSGGSIYTYLKQHNQRQSAKSPEAVRSKMRQALAQRRRDLADAIFYLQGSAQEDLSRSKEVLERTSLASVLKQGLDRPAIIEAIRREQRKTALEELVLRQPDETTGDEAWSRGMPINAVDWKQDDGIWGGEVRSWTGQ